MNIALWIIQILLALVFLVSGITKAIRPGEKLKAAFPALPVGLIRLVAVAEIVGAAGLILPGVSGITPILTPVAACGLSVVMVGAIVTHARQNEGKGVAVSAVLLVLSIVVAVGRFALPH
jgi:uncharacterized membrane protein YphA (DoxX/SURF4 family)